MAVIDERELVERAVRALVREDPSFDDLIKRRHRKRRNQRIAAGVVGIAVFVAAVWVVTSGLSLDRGEKSVAPAGEVTGPAETGPAETGSAEVTEPAETGPTETGPEPTAPPEAGWDGQGLPPEGTAPSTPVEGELIAEDTLSGIGGHVRVYTDGRVISTQGIIGGLAPYVEQRLSPEGVELVRSGALDPAAFVDRGAPLPASAWEDRERKPYVPARYGACFHSGGSPVDEAVLDLLPASAQAVLRGSDPALNPKCLEVTPEEARSLEEILSEASSSRGTDPFQVGAWLLRDGNGDQVGISLHPLYPDGRRFSRVGF